MDLGSGTDFNDHNRHVELLKQRREREEMDGRWPTSLGDLVKFTLSLASGRRLQLPERIRDQSLGLTKKLRQKDVQYLFISIKLP